MNKFDNKEGVFTTLGLCLISVILALVILFLPKDTESSKDYSVPSYINTDSAQYLEGVDYEIDRSSSHDNKVNSKEDKKFVGSSNKVSSNSSNIDSSPTYSNHINGDKCAKCKGNRIYHQVWINDNTGDIEEYDEVYYCKDCDRLVDVIH